MHRASLSRACARLIPKRARHTHWNTLSAAGEPKEKDASLCESVRNWVKKTNGRFVDLGVKGDPNSLSPLESSGSGTHTAEGHVRHVVPMFAGNLQIFARILHCSLCLLQAIQGLAAGVPLTCPSICRRPITAWCHSVKWHITCTWPASNASRKHGMQQPMDCACRHRAAALLLCAMRGAAA